MPTIDNYEALNTTITSEIGAPIVTKWLVLGELIDDDGDRRTFFMSSEQCTWSDELGLMEYHRMFRASQLNGDN